MTEYKEIELTKRIRQDVLDVLDLWSSKKEQLNYQKNVPIAQVSVELFCQWSDDNYHPDSDYFKMAFTEKEKEILADFDKSINLISDRILDNLPYITEFVNTSEWRQVNQAAIDALKKIKNTAANNG